MGYKVTMVGTGSAFAKVYHNNSALVELPSGKKLLLDCGHSVPQGLHELGIKTNEIDAIFISHLHADHIGGLEEFAFSNRYIYDGAKTTLLLPSDLVTPLITTLRSGLLGPSERLTDYFDVTLLVPFIANMKEYAGTKLTITRTNHVQGMTSYALGIGEDKDIFYTSDTMFDLDLIEKAKEYKVIYHDCQMTDKKGGEVHATLDELLTLPRDIQSKMKLMHYGDNVLKYLVKKDFDKVAKGMGVLVQGETVEYNF